MPQSIETGTYCPPIGEDRGNYHLTFIEVTSFSRPSGNTGGSRGFQGFHGTPLEHQIN